MLKNNSKKNSASLPMKIAIVGAGMGGLATAIALSKKGFDVQIYEKAHDLEAVGASLSLAPNGLNSLAAIEPGIVELLKQAGSEQRSLTLKKNTGEIIATKPITYMQKYGQPMLSIHWSRIQAILASALPPNCIHLQHRCVGFEQFDNGVNLFFPGGKTVETDLLIGADGINSIVRQNLIGDGFPNYTDRVCWWAVLKFDHKQLLPNTSTLLTSADGKNFLLIDLGEGYTFWGASMVSDDDFVHQRATTAKTRVLEQFADWAEPVGAIIEATPAPEIIERPICDRPPLQSWSSGRVVLLGDAAHPIVPSLGQGANTAFEDAFELAECLANAPSIEAAFETYETNRIPRTAVIYARSALEGHRTYKADSKTALRQMMKQVEDTDNEFEEWLYNYKPSTKYSCALNVRWSW
jgi:salicylate hydroxylase